MREGRRVGSHTAGRTTHRLNKHPRPRGGLGCRVLGEDLDGFVGGAAYAGIRHRIIDMVATPTTVSDYDRAQEEEEKNGHDGFSVSANWRSPESQLIELSEHC
jgi:hypothetical protein